MREDLIELAKQQAAEIARAGHNGWGNTMLALAVALESSAPVGVEAIKSAIAELDALRNAMFKTYAAAANGADKTKLIRLIEAERDAYEAHYSLPKLQEALAQQPAADKFAATFRCERNGIVGSTNAPIHSVSMHDDGVIEVVIYHWPEQPAAVDEATRRDAERWRAMRQTLVAADFAPEMGGGPVVMFTCYAERVGFGPEGADAIADAAVAAMQGANTKLREPNGSQEKQR